MSVADSTSVRLERTFAASASEVFDAWTNPEVLRRWWARGPSMRTAIAEVDLRVGGRYRLAMEDPASGGKHTVGGEYREVSRGERLRYTWAWEEPDGSSGHESVVTVSFHERGGSTTVVIEHTGLESERSREGHGAGWNGCLDSLQRNVFSGAP